MNTATDIRPVAAAGEADTFPAASALPTLRHHPAARHPPSQRNSDRRRHWQNRFLPTLFDRLRDDEPHQRSEAPEDYTATRNQLREIVQRDLAYLLNSTNHDDWLDSQRYEQVVSSTVNFGVPALAGSYLSERKWADIEKLIRRAITDFEPRLLPESVVVKPLRQLQGESCYNVLQFEISAMLHMQPYPVEFTVQSAVDLETNRIAVRRV